MRGIRLSREAMGFVILTTLLSLTFIASIVYAYTSEGGWKEEVSWSVSVSTNYNSLEKKTYSYHSIYVYNNRCKENGYPNPKIKVDFGFEHSIREKTPQYWTWYGNTVNVPSEEHPERELYRSKTLSLDVTGLQVGKTYHLDAYTELEIFDSKGRKIDLKDYPSDPDDGYVEETLEFTR
ncbi:hypothetical protein J7M22_10630 [Candidatus Poribacteria bacterium]|nr:hypothetical protein [Candidatus Poribacteria bacterium]